MSLNAPRSSRRVHDPLFGRMCSKQRAVSNNELSRGCSFFTFISRLALPAAELVAGKIFMILSITRIFACMQLCYCGAMPKQSIVLGSARVRRPYSVRCHFLVEEGNGSRSYCNKVKELDSSTEGNSRCCSVYFFPTAPHCPFTRPTTNDSASNSRFSISISKLILSLSLF